MRASGYRDGMDLLLQQRPESCDIRFLRTALVLCMLCQIDSNMSGYLKCQPHGNPNLFWKEINSLRMLFHPLGTRGSAASLATADEQSRNNALAIPSRLARESGLGHTNGGHQSEEVKIVPLRPSPSR